MNISIDLPIRGWHFEQFLNSTFGMKPKCDQLHFDNLAGIYVIYSEHNECLYVGQSLHMAARLRQHLLGKRYNIKCRVDLFTFNYQRADRREDEYYWDKYRPTNTGHDWNNHRRKMIRLSNERYAIAKFRPRDNIVFDDGHVYSDEQAHQGIVNNSPHFQLHKSGVSVTPCESWEKSAKLTVTTPW